MKDAEKRRTERIVDSLDAEIISNNKSYNGLIMNFSESGLYMVTATAGTIVDVTPSTVVELKCSLPSNKKLSLRCEVKWFQTKNSPHGISFSMGMEILNPPREYKDFIKSLQ
jgi:hypothetical protein